MSNNGLNKFWPLLIVLVALAVVSGAAWLAGQAVEQDFSKTEPISNADPPHRYPVHINQPDFPALVDSGEADSEGRPIQVSCGTCHDVRPPDFSVSNADPLNEFHQGLNYRHGQLSCLSCHNAEDYTTLRLADGTAIGLSESIKLCGQCHGPQYRDYQKGAHGGMMGYWDLTKGPRYRNQCIDCHDPHIPAYPQVYPVLPPHDRAPAGSEHQEIEHE